MQRDCGITAMISIKEGIHLTSIDPEKTHDKEEVDIEALIRRIEGEARGDREMQEESSRGKRSGKWGVVALAHCLPIPQPATVLQALPEDQAQARQCLSRGSRSTGTSRDTSRLPLLGMT